MRVGVSDVCQIDAGNARCRKRNGTPADSNLGPRAVGRFRISIIAQDGADTAALGNERVAAVAEHVEVEVFVRFLLAVAFDFDRDGLGGLTGGKGEHSRKGRALQNCFFLLLR